MAGLPLTQIRSTDYMLDQTTILIVDDEAGPRESLQMILSPAHRVLIASSGREALKILGTTLVDLVTVDLNMPGMKGDELMRTIRRDFPAVEIIVITGCGTMDTAVEGLRYGICDYLSKPFDVAEVSSAVSRALGRKQSRRRLVDFLERLGDIMGKDRDSRDLLADLSADSELQNRLSSALLAHMQMRGQSSSDDGSESKLEFLEILAQTLESRDGLLRGHARRVGYYAHLLSERHGLEIEELDQIRIAAFLHDLGRVGPSNSSSPQPGSVGDRQEEEHPLIGAALVQPLGFSGGIAEAIRHHHERWDGGGFPDKLSGTAIPLASRVIAIVDAYDAITSDRLGTEVLSPCAAIEELKKQAGTSFDPKLVEEFAELVESGACDLEASEASAALGGQ